MDRSAAGPDSFADHARRALAGSGLVPPDAGEVSVVLFDTTSWNGFQSDACGWLGARERARAARFRFDGDRSAYVLAHALWRLVLAVSLARDPGEVPLDFLPSGQPHLPGTALSTSLSHSGPLVLVAVGAVHMLGVDLERWPARISVDGLLPAICTPGEADALRPLPPSQRERALLQLWTRKEALLKAFGTGLAQAPAAFCVTAGEPVALPSDPGGAPCRVIDLALPADRLGALAASLDMERHRLHVPGTGLRPAR
jgi:4'-phosphopantetheinyl transferase